MCAAECVWTLLAEGRALQEEREGVILDPLRKREQERKQSEKENGDNLVALRKKYRRPHESFGLYDCVYASMNTRGSFI